MKLLVGTLTITTVQECAKNMQGFFVSCEAFHLQNTYMQVRVFTLQQLTPCIDSTPEKKG